MSMSGSADGTTLRSSLVALISLLLLAGCGSAATTADAARPDASMAIASLPVRPGPRAETTYSVPHVQVSVERAPEVDAELRRLAFSLPAVENRQSVASVIGSRGMWLDEELELARPDAVLHEREFGHIHTDGSLHLVLPVDRATEAIDAKWAEFHPWVATDSMWDGMVMLYSPQNADELEVVVQLLVESYNFVTGADVSVADLR